MARFHQLEDLQVWKMARDIARDVWLICENTDLKNDFSLRNQINRSSGSVMDNITEGFERNGNREFIQFLSIAKGSCGEVKSQLYRAYDRNHITENELTALLSKTEIVLKKIGALMSYLSKSEIKGSKFSEPESEYQLNSQPETRGSQPETQNPKRTND